MIYSCKDCSYRGNSGGQEGNCPACGSFNLARKSSSIEAPKSGALRLTLVVTLWLYLIALIFWKLNH